MSYVREKLPDPCSYYEGEGLRLTGPRSAKWKTTECRFHGGGDSMRINVATGAWVCMNCGAKGGDLLGYHMQAHRLEFIDAAKSLGAWVEDGKPESRRTPAPLAPRSALEVLSFEATVAAVAAGNLAHGVRLSDQDRKRLLTAANRIIKLAEVFT